MAFLLLQVTLGQGALAKHSQTVSNDQSQQVTVKHSRRARQDGEKSASTKRSQPSNEQAMQGKSRHSRRSHHQEDQLTVSSNKHGKRSRSSSQELVTQESTTHESRRSRRRHGKESLKQKENKKAIEKAQEPKGKKPEATEARQEESLKTHENDQLARAYSLYDSGANQRLLGNYSAAVSQLLEARQLFHMSSHYSPAEPRSDADEDEPAPPKPSYGPSPMETLALFELAQAAEGARNYEMARRSFQECIGLNPKFLPAYLRLSCLEARQGRSEEALRIARQASSLAPADPRPHSIASNLLEELGLTSEARVEQQKAASLSQINRIPTAPDKP